LFFFYRLSPIHESKEIGLIFIPKITLRRLETSFCDFQKSFKSPVVLVEKLQEVKPVTDVENKLFHDFEFCDSHPSDK